MNIPKLLRPFRNKMFWESAIKAAISSLALGSLGVFLTALINRILIRQDSFILLTAVGAGIFAIAFLLFFFLCLTFIIIPLPMHSIFNSFTVFN